MSQKKKAKKTLKHKNKKQCNTKVQGWCRWGITTFVKLSLACFCALGIYVIYLDAKVKVTFEGQRWQVPIQVFAQIERFKVGDNLNILDIAQSLKSKQYKKVSTVLQPGQFAQSSHRIVIYRRAFDFPDEASPAVKVTLDVKSNRITKLYLGNTAVAKVKLEPALLARLVPNNKEDRVLVNLQHIPTQLLDTLLLIEDRDFYHHRGISPLSILRALYHNLRAGRTVQGGSTLTQQLVKNMFLTRERSFTRKFNEALMAIILELRYSKDQLLEAYINEVYLGQHYNNGVYGFGLAANFYFGHNIDELSNAQIALLIAQIKGPSYYDPWKNPIRAKQRRDLILRLMFEAHLLTAEQFVQAVESRLSIRHTRRFSQQSFPAYLQLVKRELNQHLSNVQQKSGVRVFTGFSHRSQQILEKNIAVQLPLLEQKHQQSDLQAAMIVTDIKTGEIRALAGARESGYAGFNRAISAKRPVGSLIKPAIYLAALERYEEYNFATLLDDKAIVLTSDEGKNWQPKNYDGTYRGQVPLILGLVQSLNIPTVNLGMKLGLDKVADAIYMLGYPQEITTRPSMLLGAINMSPLEVNQLYLPIAAKGRYKNTHTIVHILSSKGDTLWQFQDTQEQRLSDNGAYLIDYALEQVAKSGTAKSLSWRLGGANVSGKTGTSNDLRDSWFIGYDGKHLVTTWVGKDNNRSTRLTGSSGALVLFAHFIKKQGLVKKISRKPETVTSVTFEPETGQAVEENCANTIRYPAVSLGISTTKDCKAQKGIGAWFEKIFGE